MLILITHSYSCYPSRTSSHPCSPTSRGHQCRNNYMIPHWLPTYEHFKLCCFFVFFAMYDQARDNATAYSTPGGDIHSFMSHRLH